jgi:hypothetical protein
MRNTETIKIYFLEWLAQESGFPKEKLFKQIVQELITNYEKKHNKKIKFEEVKNLLFNHFKNNYKSNWLMSAFVWKKSFLKPDYNFWSKIHDKWVEKYLENEYKNKKIYFSEENIDDLLKLTYKKSDKSDRIKIKKKKIKI